MLANVEGRESLRVETYCGGVHTRVVDETEFCTSGRLLLGVSYLPSYTHPPTIADQLPRGAPPQTVCVHVDREEGWKMDYAKRAPDASSHPFAAAGVYYYKAPDGTIKNVRWNIPFMTPHPLFICRGPNPLRIWIDETYYEVESGALVVMGPLLCEALLEDGPWIHPIDIVRQVERANVPSVLLPLLTDYLFPPGAAETVRMFNDLHLPQKGTCIPMGDGVRPGKAPETAVGETTVRGDYATFIEPCDFRVPGMKLPKRLQHIAFPRELDAVASPLVVPAPATNVRKRGLVTPSTSSPSWACIACRYANRSSDEACQICTLSRPKRVKL